jgi:MFS family permease
MNNKSRKEHPTLLWTALLMCILSSLFYFYEYYLRVAPSIIQQELREYFMLTPAGFGILAAYYYLAYVPLQLPVGVIMDKWGPRKILTLASAFCVVGTWMFARTDLLNIAKMGRFLVGFGSAFAYVGVLKIASIWLPKKYFAMIAGLCTAIGMLGAIAGEKIMVYLLKYMGWQQAFMLSIYVGVALTLLIWFFIRDKNQHHIAPDLTFQHKRTIIQELTILVKSKTLWINGIIGCLTFLPLTAFAELWAISYLESVGLSTAEAATCSSMVFLGYGVGGPAWGRISDLIKSRRLTLLVGSLIATMFFVLPLIIPNLSTTVLAAIFFSGAFFASAQVVVFAVANDITAKDMVATSLSFTNFLVMIGGAILQPLIGYVIEISNNYQLALCIVPVGTALAAILSYLLKETYN